MMNTDFYFSVGGQSNLYCLYSLVLRPLCPIPSESVLFLLATMFLSHCIWGKIFLWKRSRTIHSSWECREDTIWLSMLLRHFYYPTYSGLYLEGVFMVPMCCANCSVFTSKAKCDTNTLNKWWLDRVLGETHGTGLIVWLFCHCRV